MPRKLAHNKGMNLHPHQALQDVRDRIERAAKSVGRTSAEITLIAVSKTFEAPDIMPVLANGQHVFGENRVQEATAKWPDLKARHSGIELHLIGPLQTNKTADAVRLFDAIHTVDRPRIAEAISREIAKQGVHPQLFVQINTGEEVQKAGVSLVDAGNFIEGCQKIHGLSISGLMCIPPVNETPEKHFELLANFARRHNLKGLSMGMSGDFETAIKFGATHVRVGSAIFGTR